MIRKLIVSAAALLSVVVSGAVVVLGTASPASAAACVTPGHAYVGIFGRYFMSGFEGDRRFGIPTSTSGATISLPMTVGMNGVQPGTTGSFSVWVQNASGFPVQVVRTWVPDVAHGNCVSEERSGRLDLPRGRYTVFAFYTSGNTGATISDTVMFIERL